jgi:hypothetical protein
MAKTLRCLLPSSAFEELVKQAQSKIQEPLRSVEKTCLTLGFEGFAWDPMMFHRTWDLGIRNWDFTFFNRVTINKWP